MLMKHVGAFSSIPLSPVGPIREMLRRMTGYFRLRLSNRTPSGNVVRVIEDWLERAGIPDCRWTERGFPDFQVHFKREVRGRELAIFVDYNVEHCFLGLFAYFPEQFQSPAYADLSRRINEINWDAHYGNFEFHPCSGRLRFRSTLDIRGVRVSVEALEEMLEQAISAFERHTTTILAQPLRVVA